MKVLLNAKTWVDDDYAYENRNEKLVEKVLEISSKQDVLTFLKSCGELDLLDQNLDKVDATEIILNEDLNLVIEDYKILGMRVAKMFRLSLKKAE